DLYRVEDAVDDIVEAIGPAGPCREDQITVGLQAPFLQRVDDDWSDRDMASASLRLWVADHAVAVCSFLDMDHATLEIDIFPSQAAKLGDAQSSECQHNDDSAATTLRGVDYAPHLLREWEIDSGLESALAALVGSNLGVGGDVLRNVTAPPGILQQRLEALEHLPCPPLRRGFFKQIVAELFNARRGEVRKLDMADLRDDMQPNVLVVMLDGRAFAPLRLHPCQPVSRRLGNGDALAWRGVHTPAHIDLDCGMEFVGFLLAGKGADVALALRVEIIHHPGRLRFAAPEPRPLSDRHDGPSNQCCDIVLQYVTNLSGSQKGP